MPVGESERASERVCMRVRVSEQRDFFSSFVFVQSNRFQLLYATNVFISQIFFSFFKYSRSLNTNSIRFDKMCARVDEID